MNQYTQLLSYIKQLSDSDPLVNTITQGDADEIDIDKSNIFPMIHVAITGGSFTNGRTVIFNVQLSALQQRDTTKDINTDKFWGNDNEVDNLNETLAILNRMWGKMYNDFEDNGIIASENPTLSIIDHRATKNNIEGWLMDFDVEIPNLINLCP